MMYATETVLALHRARTADQRRNRAESERREERTDCEDRRRIEWRPLPVR